MNRLLENEKKKVQIKHNFMKKSPGTQPMLLSVMHVHVYHFVNKVIKMSNLTHRSAF